MSVYDFESGGAKVIASNRSNEGYFFVRWAPSGEAIMYMTLDQTNPSAPSGRLNLVKPDGTELGRMALAANSTSLGALTFGPAISDDGSKVIFAVNQDLHEGGIDGPGIYSMQLAHPIPEFPLTALLEALPVAAIVAVMRMRFMQQAPGGKW